MNKLKNIIIDTRVGIDNNSQNNLYYLANSQSLNLNSMKNIISRYAFVNYVAEQMKNPILYIGHYQNEIRNTISLQQYCNRYPQLLGVYSDKRKQINNDEPQQISAICITDLQDDWDIQTQIICDLVSTKDGKIGTYFQQLDKHIPIYYFLDCNLLKLVIQSTYELLYKQEMQYWKDISDYDILKWYSKLHNIELTYINQDKQQTKIKY